MRRCGNAARGEVVQNIAASAASSRRPINGGDTVDITKWPYRRQSKAVGLPFWSVGQVESGRLSTERKYGNGSYAQRVGKVHVIAPAMAIAQVRPLFPGAVDEKRIWVLSDCC